MTDETKPTDETIDLEAAKQMADSWTQGVPRDEATGDVRMAYALSDAIAEIRLLRCAAGTHKVEHDRMKRLVELVQKTGELATRTAERIGDKFRAVQAERDKLAAFKAYVHKRLDDAGVPVDPESSHKAEGCRIGGRLDIVLAALALPQPPSGAGDGAGWVPVAERLPERKQHVLVAIRRGPVTSGMLHESGWVFGQQLGAYANFRDAVTHWRPLPEPPTPDELKVEEDRHREASRAMHKAIIDRFVAHPGDAANPEETTNDQ